MWSWVFVFMVKQFVLNFIWIFAKQRCRIGLLSSLSIVLNYSKLTIFKLNNMQAFHCQALPIDVHFGVGHLQKIQEILRPYAYQRILIITTAGQQAAGERLSRCAAIKGRLLFGTRRWLCDWFSQSKCFRNLFAYYCNSDNLCRQRNDCGEWYYWKSAENHRQSSLSFA